MFKKNLFVLLCIFLVVGSAAQINAPQKAPKLLLVITIDNFNLEFIDKFSPLLGRGGFKRLYKQGSVFKNVRGSYAYSSSSAGIASLATGANPAMHGIVGDDIVPEGNFEDKCICEEDFLDAPYKQYSNRRLLIPNLIDELQLNSPQSKAYSLSFEPCNALYFSGKQFGTSIWFNEENGNWITQDSNLLVHRIQPDKKLLTQQWKPLYPTKVYSESDPTDEDFELDIMQQLQHIFREEKNKLFSGVKQSPFAHSYTVDIAVKLIREAQLGRGRYTDVLHLNFKALDYIVKTYGLLSAKYQDAFYRLDKDLNTLLDSLDAQVGFPNSLVVLTSPKPAFYAPNDQARMKQSSGTIQLRSAVQLLNLYLEKKFGNRRLIQASNGSEIFLNHKQIEALGIDEEELVYEVFDLLNMVTGVKRAYWKQHVLRGRFSTEFTKKLMQTQLNSLSGDIYIEPDPGWSFETGSTRKTSVLNSTQNRFPLLLFGAGVKPKNNYKYMNLIDIAPSLSELLGISPPVYSQGRIRNLLD